MVYKRDPYATAMWGSEAGRVGQDKIKKIILMDEHKMHIQKGNYNFYENIQQEPYGSLGRELCCSIFLYDKVLLFLYIGFLIS
jgi:hypothetical protein